MNKKICVVGAGSWGENHINSLDQLGVLKGIVEPNKERLQKFTDQFPSVLGYKNLDQALEYPYDGFIVATPAKTHYKISKKLIQKRKPILIEKPMTLTVNDAKDLVNLADIYNVNVMVGHVLLFHPAIIKLKEIIDKGIIGKLQYIYSNRLNLGKIRTEENVFWSLAPHDIAIFQFLTNSIPNNIQASGSTFIQNGIYDSTLTHLEYENGVEGHIFVSWLHPFKEHRLVVIGSEAMISFEDSLKSKPLKLYSKKIDLVSGIPEKIDGPIQSIQYENKMPLIAELEYFVDHIRNKKPKIANIKHGYEVVKILVETSKQLGSALNK